ncbi:ABC-type glycerol-3-phosphate transport system substrate-binding protein [Mycetocola sp. BIGb0189]|uniref:ABC transporter substrate-binding protein n=1 Tax=Mycetocola sp. BIGb0189 TaxID=2940604 RepID=UPI0021678FE2|nr:sugar ABC transporter substrate-binding protein [Mycetocola sp. BIGb0189]MCS4277114.1 ABC-type glycerol-3-phosphate transport system substrate-binding protein [Mycetocola sp. BIGb0189]
MKRRLMFGVAVAAAAALTLAGCSGSGDSKKEAGSLTWAMWIAGQEDQNAWQKVADQVTTDNPGVKVTIQGAPWNDYWTKISTQLSSNNAPCIVSMQSLRVSNYTEGLLPLDELVKKSGLNLDEYDRSALDGLTVDGKLYALPYDTGPMLLFYNKDMFREAGVELPTPDWSVDQFEAAGEKFKAKGKTLFASTVEDLYLESQMLAYNGGKLLKSDGSLDIENPEFAKGLDWLNSLVKKGYATQASGADSSADDNAFVNGDAASYIDGAFSLLGQKAKVKFDLGVATLPAGTTPATYSAGSGFGISKQCDQPEDALKAITTMTGEKVLTELASAGRAFPARTAAQPAWFANTGLDGVEETFAAAQKSAIPLPGNPASEQINQLLAQYAIQAINGQSTGAEVLKQIAAQIPSK